MSNAQTARDNGWTVGTQLVGDEGYGPTVIEITAIGREKVLACMVSHNGRPDQRGEASWSFHFRDWQVHEPPPPCGAYSHGTDGWSCAATGPHDEHHNAARDVTWPRTPR